MSKKKSNQIKTTLEQIKKKIAIAASYDPLICEIFRLIVSERLKINPKASNRKWWIDKGKEELYEDLFKRTSFLNQDSSFLNRLFVLFNNIQDKPKCPVCQVDLKFDRGYPKSCSLHTWQCSGNEIETKRKDTMLEKYGEIKNFSNENHRKSVKKTMIEKYGVEHPMDDEVFKEKSKATSEYRYGKPFYTQTDEYQKKRIETCYRKYGTSSHMHLKYYQDMVTGENNANYKGWNSHTDDIVFEYREEKQPKQILAQNYGYSISHFNKILKKLDLETDLPQNKIYPPNKTSRFEDSVYDFVSTLVSSNIERSKRKYIGQEFDLYIPEYKVAIECNGLYWHSEIGGSKDKNYHRNKLIKTNKLGIRLVNIWQDDWTYRREIVESRLTHLFGKSSKIYARNTKLCSVGIQEERSFLEKNHLQGYVKSDQCVGLYDRNGLCALMSFSNDNSSNVKILRFCSSVRTVVTGGFSKLLLHYISKNQPLKVIATCDRSFDSGDIYKNLGFELLRKMPPSCCYTKGYKIRETHVKDLPRWQNIKQNGYDRIWDCGSEIWQYSTNLDK